MPTSPRIQVLLDQTDLPAPAARVLRRLGAEIELSSFERHDRPQSAIPIDARLIISADGGALCTSRLDQLQKCCDANPSATIIWSLKELSASLVLDTNLTDHGVNLVYNPPEDELAAQLSVMAGLRGPIAAMRRELVELRTREVQHLANLRKFGDEQRLAGVVQREFLSSHPPTLREGKWLTLYGPAEVVSGDLYDVVRLDEEHIAMSLMDATGHGLTAALLAAYARKWMRRGDSSGEEAAAYSPESMLRRMNQELLSTQLSECQFISAIQAVYNERTQEMTWSRGGGCYPILVRRDHPSMQIRSEGPLVGVSPDARFETVRIQLRPGDTLLFHTDGLETLMGDDEENGRYDITATEWFAALTEESIHDQIEAIRRRLDDPGIHLVQRDDVTVIGLHLPALPLRTRNHSEEPEESLAGVYL